MNFGKWLLVVDNSFGQSYYLRMKNSWRIIAEVRAGTPRESDPAVIMFFDPVEGVIPTVHNHPLHCVAVHNIFTGPGGDPTQALWYEVDRLCRSYAKSPRKRR